MGKLRIKSIEHLLFDLSSHTNNHPILVNEKKLNWIDSELICVDSISKKDESNK